MLVGTSGQVSFITFLSSQPTAWLSSLQCFWSTSKNPRVTLCWSQKKRNKVFIQDHSFRQKSFRLKMLVSPTFTACRCMLTVQSTLIVYSSFHWQHLKTYPFQLWVGLLSASSTESDASKKVSCKPHMWNSYRDNKRWQSWNIFSRASTTVDRQRAIVSRQPEQRICWDMCLL